MKKIDYVTIFAMVIAVSLLDINKEVVKGLITGCVIGWIVGRRF